VAGGCPAAVLPTGVVAALRPAGAGAWSRGLWPTGRGVVQSRLALAGVVAAGT